MVTAAAVAIPMCAGQADVRAAVADKTQGEVKTFAESLGEQAEMELCPGTAMDVSQETVEVISTKNDAASKVNSADASTATLTGADDKTVAGMLFASVKGTVADHAAIAVSNVNTTSSTGPGTDRVAPVRSPQVELIALSASSGKGNQDAVVDQSALSVAVEQPVRVAGSDDGGETQTGAAKSTGEKAQTASQVVSQTESAAGTTSAPLPAPVGVTMPVQQAPSHMEHGATVENTATTGVDEKQPVSGKKVADKKQDVAEKTGIHQQDANAVGIVVVNAVQPAVVPAVSAATAVEKPSVITAAVAVPRVVSGKETQPAASKGDASMSKQNTAAKTVADGQRTGTEQDGHVAKGDANVVGRSLLAVGGSQPAPKAGQETVKVAASVVTTANDGGTKLKSTVAAVAASPVAIASGAAPAHLAAAPFAKAQGSDAGAQPGTIHVGAGESGFAGTAASSTPDVAHRTLSASPTTLEVGIPNGTEGWLKIRAEMASGGGVNASLSAASPASQEMLHRELPSLTAFLQQERVAVNTVVVHPLSAAATRAETGGMGGGMSGQAQQRNGQGGDGGRAMQGVSVDHDPYSTQEPTGADEILSPLHYAGGGSWLSVRA